MNTAQLTIDFDGGTFHHALDGKRLGEQLGAVMEYMIENTGKYSTLRELSEVLGYPEASISARLRDLRKPRCGAHTIARRRRTTGTWEYSLIRSNDAQTNP